MRPKERQDGGQTDLFKSHLDQIVNLNHALVKLSRAIDWGFLEQQFGAVYDDEPGRPAGPADAADGRVGNPYDNAHAESFMKTLKQEEVNLQSAETAFRARLPHA